MSDFILRLRFQIPDDVRFYFEEARFNFTLSSGRPILLIPQGAKRIIDTHFLAFVGEGFATIDDAKRHGLIISTAAKIASTRLRMGIDVGIDRTSFEQKGLEWADDFSELGIEVFKYSIPKKITLGNARGTSLPKIEEFIEVLDKVIELNPSITDKQAIALDLYNYAQFESSSKARFLILYAALESLVTVPKRSKEEIHLLNNYITTTRDSELPADKKSRLINALGNLKSESTSSACKEFVESVLGPDQLNAFETITKLRHKLLHDGQIPDGVDFQSETSSLDGIVMGLLMKTIIVDDILFDVIKKHRKLKSR